MSTQTNALARSPSDIPASRFGAIPSELALTFRLRSKRRQLRFDRELYRERNVVERLIKRLKQFRRIATRYEKLSVNFLAMVRICQFRSPR